MRNKIKKKIEAIMRGGGKSRFFSLESFLFIVSLSYGGAVKLRESCYRKGIIKSKKLPCKVISIGNITVGGTGKTPMTIHVAELVNQLGYSVAIISRGYKGGAEKTGGIVSNGQSILMGADSAGDEPFMMASKLKNSPVVVGRNRFETGLLAVKKFNPDVIVLDDAFQHLKLERDIDIVLLDNRHPFGNTHLLPRGILREPVSSLLRGDVFVFTRSDSVSDSVKATSLAKLKGFRRGRPVFYSSHVPYLYKVKKGKNVPSMISQSSYSCDFEFLKGRKVVAFSGIAINNDFRRTVEGLKCYVTDFLEFPDHHLYSDDDFYKILRSVRDANTDFILTTEKDYVRIAHRITWPVDLVVIGIKIFFGDDDAAFSAFIKSRLTD